MKVITVNKNQSIWDLAIQEYGAAEGAKQLIIDNPNTLNFSLSIAAGAKVNIDESKIINKTIVDYLSKGGYKPCTAYNEPPGGYSTGFNLGFN